MDGKYKMAITVISAAVVLLTVTCVTASSRGQDTPLYTVRMEQASSRMNFLPTAMNEFTYSAENGCTLNYNASVCSDNEPLVTHQADTWCTCWPWCETTEYTCESEPTCMMTCNTCINPTCPDTCFFTCQGVTCTDPTCPDTCTGPTCDQSTCSGNTCEGTCEGDGYTCNQTSCQPTCYTCLPTSCYTCLPTCETCYPIKTCDPFFCDTFYCLP